MEHNFNEALQIMLDAVKEHISLEIKSLSDRIDALEKKAFDIDEAFTAQDISFKEEKDKVWVEFRNAFSDISNRAEEAIKRCAEIKPIKGDRGDDGRDGRDGKDGDSGRDAMSIDVLPSIDESRSYPPRTYASHRGGLWVSRRKTDGMEGWECIIDGVSSIESTQEDARNGKILFSLSSGETREHVIKNDTPIYQGVYNDQRAYSAGDCVTYAGSIWIALENEPKKPEGEGSGWRLAVKKGRDGRTGKNGKDGEKGERGLTGSYLNSLNNQILEKR